jgi:aminoglycoside phosphotransferase (APT) family kinase protein
MRVKSKIALSKAQAQAIVDRLGVRRKVARVSVLYGGGTGATYTIQLTDGAAAFVLKIYPAALHWKMQKEVAIARLLQNRLSVAVPEILLADETSSFLPLNFVLMTKLDGKTMPEFGTTFNREETCAIFTRMGEVLREINAVAMDAFGYIGPHGIWTPFATNRTYMSAQFDEKLSAFCEHGGDGELAQHLKEFVAHRVSLFDACKEAKLCHYDFSNSNVLIERRDGSLRLTGILDFEGAIAGDPLMDLAKALYYAPGDDERAALAAGYGAVERQDRQETLTLYRVYCVLEIWVWFAQTGKKKPLAGLARELGRLA